MLGGRDLGGYHIEHVPSIDDAYGTAESSIITPTILVTATSCPH
jgi:hypothetical protein